MTGNGSRLFAPCAHRAIRGLAWLLFLAACSQSEPATQQRRDPEAAFRAHLGHQWELVRLGELEVPAPTAGTPPDSPGRDLVPGRRPTIRFVADPPSAGGRSFCNGYGGPYELRGDSLAITRIESTAVGCDGPDSLETRFFRALRETRTFEVDSARLVLLGEGGALLTFVRAADR